MDALTALRTRRSIRHFENRSVSREALETMVDCAHLAATDHGVQPWEFVAVTDLVMLTQLAERCEYGKYLSQASAAIIVLCRETKYYLEDGCNAMENLLFAGTALGSRHLLDRR